MDPKSLAENLRHLRIERELTQSQVAERAGLSSVAYRSIENGQASPRLTSLMRIASALEVTVDVVVASAPPRPDTLKSVRFRAQKKLVSRDHIVLQVARWLKNYNHVEHILGAQTAFRLDDLARAATAIDRKKRPIAAASHAREALGLTNRDTIRDLCGLLEDHGVKVYALPLASPDGFFGLSVGRVEGGPAVVVNVWDRIPVERWLFSAAHELGHLLLHLEAFDIAQTAENDEEETEANQFASHFLMPDTIFQSEWEEARGLPFIDRVLKIKRIFRVSYKTVLYRIADQIPDVWRRFQAEYKRRLGRTLRLTDEPMRVSPAEFMTDRLDRLVRLALERELVTFDEAARLLDISKLELKQRIASWR